MSLEKLKDLDVEYACADHYGYVAGDEARGFIQRSINRATEDRTYMEEVFRRTKDIEVAANEVNKAFCEQHPEYIIIPAITQGIFRQMVRHIAASMDTG
jgi:hypothetical protein